MLNHLTSNRSAKYTLLYLAVLFVFAGCSADTDDQRKSTEIAYRGADSLYTVYKDIYSHDEMNIPHLEQREKVTNVMSGSAIVEWGNEQYPLSP